MKNLKEKVFRIVFKADTKAGKLFDVVLLILILASIVVILLDSIADLKQRYHEEFLYIEWGFTLLFTLEYLLRILIVRKPLKYIRSFYGIVDLLAILPTYISLFLIGTHGMVVLRALRLLRMFRVFKLDRYINAGNIIMISLKRSRAKISVFLVTVVLIVTIVGTFMYLIEGGENGFTNIPRSIYWAIVTLTTVGYGDISPQTGLGQMLASFLMITGYAIIAVPTGIVTAELTKLNFNGISCMNCGYEHNASDGKFCSQCGNEIKQNRQ